MENRQTTITKDVANNTIIIVREFNAPLKEVWKAWTNSDILDSWWAPKPYKAKTKTMDFKEGGFWLYNMEGPEGDVSYCRADFEKIIENESFIAQDGFCNENGDITQDVPGMHWKNKFSETADGTKVEVEVTFASEADMEKIIEMGFEEGFTMAHGNLDEVLKKEININ